MLRGEYEACAGFGGAIGEMQVLRLRGYAASLRMTILRVCRSFLRLEEFGGQEVAHGFAASGEGDFCAFDENFCGAGAGVVVGGETHAVGSGVEESYEVSGFDLGDGAVA